MRLDGFEDVYPLSPLQQGLLFESLAASHRDVYFNQCRLRLRGAVDPRALARAWRLVAQRHAALRTFFVWDGLEEPVQVVEPTADPPFEVHDLGTLGADRRDQALEAALGRLRQGGFELSRAPLLRVDLFHLGERSHELAWSYHHLILDGWSTFLVLDQVLGAYDALLAGREPAAERPRPYRDYIAWLRSRDSQRAESFWREELAGAPAASLPAADAGAGPYAAPPGPVQVIEERLDAATTAALRSRCRDWRVTPNTVVQLAWGLLLRLHERRDDVLFGTVISGRPPELAGYESMVGLFINTVPVRLRLDPADRLAQALGALQSRLARVREHGHCRLADLQRWSATGGRPLFDSLVLFENYRQERPIEAMCESVAIERVSWFERTSYPLAIVAIPGEGLDLRFVYGGGRFGTATVGALATQLATLLRRMSEGGDPRLGELSPIGNAERRRLAAWSGGRTDYPRERCIDELFAEQARRAPARVALECGDQRLTYRQLDERANRLAHHLRALGVGPEVPVGVCLERSPELIVALLAILKAGGAYVPLDPQAPRRRLAGHLEDLGISRIVTVRGLAAVIPATRVAPVCLDAERARIAAQPRTRPPGAAIPEQLAYVMFTSGSTGEPKPIAVPHRGVVRLVRGADSIDFGPDEVILGLAPPTFDASTLEIWGSLLHGARLVLPRAGTPTARALGEELSRHRVTTLWLTAGLFHHLVDESPGVLAGVHQVIAGGDVVRPAQVEALLRLQPGLTFVNGYGPTENTTFSSCFRVATGDRLHGTVPIGRPVANSRCYVLGPGQRLVPVLAPGELYVAGDGLARGYPGRPGLTAERFLPDPFAERPGERMYRTGDLARWRADGNLEFLGRLDRQVKIRGFRVEPAEVEAALLANPAVRACAVVSREDRSGSRRLVGYVVAEGAPSASGLREHVRGLLPEYMVPAVFVSLDRLPLTANGKVDLEALPVPAGGSAAASDTPGAGNAAETAVAGIWADVLELDELPLDGNFFDLGGDSLRLLRVHGRLEALAQREIRIVELLARPTVRQLAALVAGGDDAEAAPVDGAAAPAGTEDARRRRHRRRRALGSTDA